MVDELTKVGEKGGVSSAGGGGSGKHGVTDYPGAGEGPLSVIGQRPR